jgi:succinate dehydrogenase/fumarate reductase flavoprotein subunit
VYYTPEMVKSRKRVEATREFRLTQDLPLLDPVQKVALLESYHPDYIEDVFRELKVGPSKGTLTPKEFANVFEAYSAIDPEKFDLSTIDYDVDVLVIGGGGAGAAAALVAHEHGADVLLVTKLRFGDANTIMAQGGIQGASKETDSPPIHYLDAMGGGRYFNSPDLVEILVRDAPEVLEWLEKLGVMFDKAPDGTLLSIHGGGTSRKRMHAARDYTGGEIMKTLRDEVQNRKIPYVEFSPAYELLTDGNTVTGAVLHNLETQEYLVVRAKTVILATGGAGRLHVAEFPTTNHYGATADGLVLGYRVGAPLLFMDTIQYHPTGAAYPEQLLGQLVTEKVRGLGGQLVNTDGHRFIYELETRDVEAAAIIRECHERKKGVTTPSGYSAVWLDTPIIDVIHGAGTIHKRLPAMDRQYKRFDINMAETPILVYPTQHYQNGGLEIDGNTETKVENLFAAGEITGGVHGRNRLMGNSLLDVVVFGRRAGAAAAERAVSIKKPGKLSLKHLQAFHEELEAADIPHERLAPMLLPDYRRSKATEKKLVVLP